MVGAGRRGGPGEESPRAPDSISPALMTGLIPAMVDRGPTSGRIRLTRPETRLRLDLGRASPKAESHPPQVGVPFSKEVRPWQRSTHARARASRDREFVKTVGSAAMAASTSLILPDLGRGQARRPRLAGRGPSPKAPSETAVARFFASLKDEQRKLDLLPLR